MSLLAACGGEDDATDAGPPDAAVPTVDASLDPATLAETGLYSDFASQTLAPGVIEYTVNYELWADGASKRRFIQLPDGADINTSNMNFWSFPVGTKLWKEFSSGGTRVETRLIWKQGPTEADWYGMSYAWNQEGTAALAAADGVEDALGTQHDIPRANACETCHARQPGFVLGFGALQLDHDRGAMNLPALVEQGRLSAPPPSRAAPIFPLPGSPVAQAALGYLHGNCGPCHNRNSDVFVDKTQIIWHLDVALLGAVEQTTIYTTTVDRPPLILLGTSVTAVIEPGDRFASAAIYRMTRRDPSEDSSLPMPPLATEVPDTAGGVAAVGAWIDSLSPTPP